MTLTTPRPMIKTLITFLIFITIPSQLLAELTVSANRNQYAPGDNISLKIESTQPDGSALDLSPLKSAFIVLDEKQMTINSYAEGKRTSIARWEIQLRARKSGYLAVPSLIYNSESSPSFNVFIKSSSRARFLPVSNMPVILDAQLDRDDNYEKSQFIYTLNLYSDRPLESNYSLSPPKIANAKVIHLDSSEIQKIEIRGTQYQLQELRYAIFPYEMGRFVIEGPVFNGSQQGDSLLEVRANNLEINVRPRQDFNNAKYWLAAKELIVNEQWDKKTQLQVSDVIERKITLQIQGIAAADIPDIEIPYPQYIKLLSSNVTLSDKIDKNGIQGTKIITQKILLLERGELTFNQISIYWWDTKEDSQKIAIIDKNILNVMPGPNGESSIEREIAQNRASGTGNTEVTVISADSPWLLWALIALSALSSLGWIYNVRKIKRFKDSQAEAFHADIAKNNNQTTANQDDILDDPQQRTATANNRSFNANAELNTFQTLGRSCLKHDLISAHRRLLEWANQYWYQQNLLSIQDISAIANNQELSSLIFEIQQLLDNHDVGRWKGDQLFSLLSKIRKD